MKHWSAEFQPRSLCSFGDSDGGPTGSSDSGPGDTSGFFGGDSSFSGDTSGFTGGFDAAGDPTASTLSNSDFFGDTTSNFQADTGGQFFGDTTTGDSFPSTVSSSDSFTGSFPTGGDSWTGADTGGFFGGGPIGGPQGWGDAGWSAQPNAGLNAAVGPPGWATSDFGGYGAGGPTGTGFGPGAGPSIGGPQAYSSNAPGITGFPGDFGAPPGGTFGMPASQGDVGPQTGPGLPGGPGNVGNAEPGFMPAGPETNAPTVAPATVPTDQRGENFFGPPGQETASSFFGPSQAQAASRGTDAQAIALQSDPFAMVEATANQVAQNNPALADALMAIATNQNTQTNMVGPMMTGFEGVTPGAQQGFTGMSPAQQAASGGPFTGQAAAFGPDSTQGKGDRGETTPAYQMSPGDIRGSVDAAQQANQQAAMQQAAMFDAQALGEQGRGARSETETTPQAQTMTPNQTVANAFTNFAPAFDFGPDYGPQAPGLAPPGQLGPGMVMADPNATPGATNFGQAIPGAQFAAPTQATPQTETRGIDPNAIETIARSDPELTTGLIGPLTQGLGRDAAPLGLWGMSQQGGRPGGSPFGTPSQTSGRSGAFGPSQTSGRTSDSGRPGLSITVGNNQFAGRGPSQGGRGDPGYYNTGGRGVAPGAKGAEYGGIYGPGVATGRPGTNTFGVDSRSGAFGFYDPATGLYFR